MLEIRLRQDSGTNPEWPFFFFLTFLLWTSLGKASGSCVKFFSKHARKWERQEWSQGTTDQTQTHAGCTDAPSLYSCPLSETASNHIFMWFQSWSIHPELLISSRLITAGNNFFSPKPESGSSQTIFSSLISRFNPFWSFWLQLRFFRFQSLINVCMDRSIRTEEIKFNSIRLG